MNFKTRVILSILIIWTFLNSFLFIISSKFHGNLVYSGKKQSQNINILYNPNDYFFPFTKHFVETKNSNPPLDSHGNWNPMSLVQYGINFSYFDYHYYDFTEFFIYVFGSWVVFFVYLILFSKFKPNQKSN
jgi:hypothetical protein